MATFKSKATVLNLIQSGKKRIGLVIYNVIKVEVETNFLPSGILVVNQITIAKM